MKLHTAVQEGCGYKDTLSAYRYFTPSAKYFTLCITYQPPLVLFCSWCVKWFYKKQYVHANNTLWIIENYDMKLIPGALQMSQPARGWVNYLLHF